VACRKLHDYDCCRWLSVNMLLKAKLWASQLNNATDCDASEQGMIGFWKNIINTNAFPLATINQSSAKPQALYTKNRLLCFGWSGLQVNENRETLFSLLLTRVPVWTLGLLSVIKWSRKKQLHPNYIFQAKKLRRKVLYVDSYSDQFVRSSDSGKRVVLAELCTRVLVF